MAPVAVSPQATPVFNKRDGQALEDLSDAIDEVNVLKDMKKREAEKKIAEEKGLYEESEFDKEKDKTRFRQYKDACDRVKNFYRSNTPSRQWPTTCKPATIPSKVRAEMTVWEAMEKLNTLIDESDPDTILSQIEHLLQSAEAIRSDGKPRWMQLDGTHPRPRQAALLLRCSGPVGCRR